jgi:hypothetical protein
MSFPSLFTSPKADGTDTTKFRPSDLNNITALLDGLFNTPTDPTGAVMLRASTDRGASWTSSLTMRDAALGNVATGLSNLLLSQNIDDGSGDFVCVHAVDNVTAGASTRNVFEVRRDGGARVSDYFIVGPDFLTTDHAQPIFVAQAMIAAYSDLGASSDASVAYFLGNGLNGDLLHMDALGSVAANGRLTGARRFTFDAFGVATASSGSGGGEWVAPYFVGGTAAADGVEIRATHGNADSSSLIRFTTGNNGSLTAIKIDKDAHVGIGITPVATLHVGASEARMQDSNGAGFSYWSFYASNGTTRRGTVGMDAGGTDLGLTAETGVLRLTGSSGIKLTGSLGFYGTTPIAQQVLATGAGKTVDNVITALQALGLVKQS